MNSFGHPVPKVDGKLQKDGGKARAVVVERKQSDRADSCLIDFTSAYPSVSSLKKLTRRFVYSREGKGRFTVEDEYTADKPLTFETALTTRAQWKQTGENRLELTQGKEKLTVTVEASSPVSFKTDTVEVNCPPYTRIGIELKGKAEKGKVKLTFE